MCFTKGDVLDAVVAALLHVGQDVVLPRCTHGVIGTETVVITTENAGARRFIANRTTNMLPGHINLVDAIHHTHVILVVELGSVEHTQGVNPLTIHSGLEGTIGLIADDAMERRGRELSSTRLAVPVFLRNDSDAIAVLVERHIAGAAVDNRIILIRGAIAADVTSVIRVLRATGRGRKDHAHWSLERGHRSGKSRSRVLCRR